MNLTAFGLASLIGMATVTPVTAAEPAHPTIRHMAGAPVVASLDAAKTAVLVIDFQNEYFDGSAAPGFAGGRMVIPDGVAALRQAKRVVEFADAHGIRVIHVQHVLPAASMPPSIATCSRARARPWCRRTTSACSPVTRPQCSTRC